jgi:hypothetical protein
MKSDLTLLAQALAPLALAAFTAAVPYGLVLTRRAIGVKLTTQLQADVIAAVDWGAQAAYGSLITNGGSIFDAPARSAAIAAGTNHVLENVAPALKALNITPQRVYEMVNARLGGLLAVDPTATISAATSVVRTALPPRTS